MLAGADDAELTRPLLRVPARARSGRDARAPELGGSGALARGARALRDGRALRADERALAAPRTPAGHTRPLALALPAAGHARRAWQPDGQAGAARHGLPLAHGLSPRDGRAAARALHASAQRQPGRAR